MPQKIKQPKNKKIEELKAKFTLEWNKTFGAEQTKRFNSVQAYVDSECIRLMSKYTPMKNGLLFKSPVIGTVIGSGHIVYSVPYARYQYYGVVYGPNIPIRENGTIIGFWSPPKKTPTNRELKYKTHRHPQAQKLWFEVMKQNHKEQILRGAAAEAAKK